MKVNKIFGTRSELVQQIANEAKGLVECPACRGWGGQTRRCKLCNDRGLVTEQQSSDYGAEP